MSILEPGRPCMMCGVRPDVDCAHRPGDGSNRAQPPSRKDGRSVDRNQGLSFKVARQKKWRRKV